MEKYLKKGHDGNYVFDWDSPELQEQVKGTIEFLTKGCSCKKKGCKTNQCGYRKTGRHCGPGFDCHGCTNLFEGTNSDHEDPDEQSDAESEETDQEDQNSECSSSSEDEEEDGIETEMITDTFDQLMLEQLDMT